MDNPLVSIIVNTVDRPQDLSRCLSACFSQTYPRFEIVVVNNGFGQETQQLLQDFSSKANVQGIKFTVVEDKTKKLSYLFNVGWRSASQDASIFAYCADDTEPDANWVRSIVAHLTIFPDAGAVSGPTISTTQPPGEMFNLYSKMKKHWWGRVILTIYEYFVMEGKTFEPGRWCQSGAFTMGAGIELPQIKEPVEIELLTSGNMGVRRETMEKVNGFDENFYFNHADGDLFIRMGFAGYKMMFDPEVRVLHHMRFGPTRHPEIMGRDTAFYYLKDVRPQGLRGWAGWFLNLGVFLNYWVYRAIQEHSLKPLLSGWGGFLKGIRDFFATNSLARNRIISKLTILILFVVLMFLLHFRLGQFWGSLAYGDCLPWPRSAGEAFNKFFSGWDPISPGAMMPQQPVLSSLTFFEGVLISLCGGNSVLAQWVFHFAPLPLAFVLCYFSLLAMYKLLSPKREAITLIQKVYGFNDSPLLKDNLLRIAAFIASFAYSFNLVAIGEMTGGYEGNMYVHAFLPIMVLFIAKITLKQKILLSWLSLTILFAVSYLFSDHIILYFLIIVPWFILLGGFLSLRGKSFKTRSLAFLKGSFSTGILLATSFVLALPLTWFYSYYFIKTALPFLGGSSGLRPDVLEFLIRNVNDTYRYWTIGDTLRQGGGAYHNLFRGGVFWARAGFALPFLAISPWLFAKNWRGRRFWLIFSATLSAAFVVWFVAYTRAVEFLPIHRVFPALFRLRNPARLNLLVSFFYSPLIFLGVFSFLERLFTSHPFKRFEYFKVFLFAVLTASLLGLSYYYRPIFSGTYTLDYNRGKGMVVAPFYKELTDFIAERHQEEDFFRTLYVPWDHENAEVKLYWLDPWAYGVPINYGAYFDNEYIHRLSISYHNLATEIDLDLGARLAAAGVKYLVVLKVSQGSEPVFYRYDYQTPWLLGPANQYERIFNAQQDLLRIVEKEDYIIYQNNSFDPQLIDPLTAGYPPSEEELSALKSTKQRVVVISFTFWGILLLFWFYSLFVSSKTSPKVFWKKFSWGA